MTRDIAHLNNVQGKTSLRSEKGKLGRADQRDRLVACAEAAIANGGLAALRARDLAACVGCSLGAIYNLVADLDELVLLVHQRTLAALAAHLDRAAIDASAEDQLDKDQFVAWARAYAAFAAENRNRWRALFEFRMAPGTEFPEWFAREQMRLFARLEARLGRLLPGLDEAALRLRARTFFSAVHGIVALGLEGKLAAQPIEAVDGELIAFLDAYIAGLRTSAAAHPPRA